MTLFTAHKILISSGVALFVFYAAIEARAALGGAEAAWMRAAVSAVAALGLGVYLRAVIRRGHI